MLRANDLYVVSDLHLGGARPLQIFDQGRELAAFLEFARWRAESRDVVVVLNGDIVDFLADTYDAALQTETAAGRLRTFAMDSAFAPVFAALQRFTAQHRAQLVLVIGNHDVELALPKVRSQLLALVCGTEPARGRVHLALDGAGTLVDIGGQIAFCVHGNDFDDWNYVDHALLRDICAALTAGLHPREWVANAGTRLVVEVMNDVKRTHPFVDLLKPEGMALLAILAALDRRYLKKLQHIGGIGVPFLKRKIERKLERVGVLGEDATSSDVAPYLVLDRGATEEKERVATLLRQLGNDVVARTPPRDLAEMADTQLGLGGLVWNVAEGGDTRRDLRETLEKWLAKDVTFSFETRDDMSDEADRVFDPSLDFVILGHSHLERALLRKRGGGVYFNSGTWIRLVRLRSRDLATDAAFEPVLAALQARSLDALEPWTLRRNTVVAITEEGGDVVGELRHVERAGANLELRPVEGTRFARARRG